MTALRDMTDDDLKGELEQVARMVERGPIGNRLDVQGRIAALLREAARRIKRVK